ncbi:NUDIX domain-containing protein [uncultured Chryseobacterium sp.]|uniref:NUDIX domain-containing protein n=1 Tax=uncultured Chryseobacterium sp. TaxID=259322 RepID=UPI00260AD816|nr:NUDIX domain-containing protein [uncultured Chryseobacterium sp.]
MKKLLPKFGAPIFKFFWKVFKPQTLGVRAILIKEDKILLVKHTYSNSWFLPGGGMKKGETFETAIKRELNEELGITVQNLKLQGIYNSFFEGKNDSIFVFLSDNFEISGKKDAEIDEFEFFDLPEKTSPGTRKRIAEFVEGNSPYHGMW